MLEIRSLSSLFRHTYIDESASTYDKVLANLHKRKKGERLAILDSLKGQYELSSEVKEKPSKLQKNFLVHAAPLQCICFPSLI